MLWPGSLGHRGGLCTLPLAFAKVLETLNAANGPSHLARLLKALVRGTRFSSFATEEV